MAEGDIVTRFLDALKSAEPPTGYLVVIDDPRLEADFTEVPSVAIDGWVYRSDLKKILLDLLEER